MSMNLKKQHNAKHETVVSLESSAVLLACERVQIFHVSADGTLKQSEAMEQFVLLFRFID